MVFRSEVINFRISFVIFTFVLLWLSLYLRSAYLQLLPQERLSQLQNKLFERTVLLKPRRGTIYDRNNKELAISIPSQSLFADPKQMNQPYYVSKKLAELFQKPKKSYLKKLLNKKRRFVWIKRHVTEKELQTVKSWKLKGLYFLKENKRFYSNEKSLSQVLGFTGLEGQGLEGLEKKYNEVLTGEDQKVFIQRDAKGRPLFMDFSPFITKVSGYDIYLTIDSDLQFYLEKALKKGIQRSQAHSAMGLIVSAQNSEILAMANLPNYNLNKAHLSSSKLRRNRTVTDIFEPGSTMKIFTLISALKKGISPTKVYSTHEGKLEINSHIIKEAHTKKTFKPFLNMSEILSLSSNVGSSSMALEIGDKALRNTLIEFGFGKKTGVDFPGEASGLLKKTPWKDIETATISFGHGIAGTALQVVNSFTAIANGGFLKKPILVKKIKNPYTGEEKIFKSQNLRQVLTEKQSQTLSLMLTTVTEKHGTGFAARVPGYFVAGKTGTAQKVDLENRGYKKGVYISSFIGFIPAHKPRFVIYLVIDDAKNSFYSSQLVAPLFSEVASYAVRQAGLSPAVLKRENILSERKTAGELKSNSQENSLDKIPFNSLQSVLKPPSLSPHSSDLALSFKMPDLRGLSLRQVLNQLKNQNLKLYIKGSGILVQSKPSHGKWISKDQDITLIFSL
ncbi:MAG: PASTA domain-containing protein [Bdellovibrionales bacterium]|nr:PASTA domain-containing protein [Bdellovibrionales bacterium]